MKKNVMLMALLLMSTVIFAQRQMRDPKAMADKRSDRMKTELSLNDEQYAKVKAINEKFAESYAQLRRDKSLTSDAVRSQMKSMQRDHETQLEGVLTADQLAQWKAMKAKQIEERRIRRQSNEDRG